MDELVSRVHRAATAVDPVLRAVTREQLGTATPCEGWDLRRLLDHFFGTLHRWAARLDGRDPDTVAVPTLAGGGDDDVAQAWQSARDPLLAALAVPGALDREVPMPMGPANARMLATIMPVELMLHGWDTARAIGASTDLDPVLATELLDTVARPLMASRRAPAFGEEQPAPPGATAADRLAAFSGRRV